MNLSALPFQKGSLLLLVPLLLIRAANATAADLIWEPAPRADDFVNSIGVCTHWSYGNTPYGKAFDLAKQRLAESGIRHIRDGFDSRELELWRDLGIQSTLVCELRLQNLDGQMASWKAISDILDMIEGPNEPNNFWLYKDKVEEWPQGVRLWQNALYQAVRAEPTLAKVPVTSPTPILEGPYEIAPLTSFDYIAIHPYAGGEMPSASIPWGGKNIRRAFAILAHDNDAKPLVATESGYHNCVAPDRIIAGQPGISETAGGRYFPRHFAEYWNAGFARTFTYEFLDESLNPKDPEANFGMLRNDLTPKPAFTAVSNLISILGEGHWDRDARHWVRAAAPDRAFPLAIEGSPNIHHTVLSRADGAIDLLLWREVSSYDLQTRQDLSSDPEQVTVRLAAPVAATLYRPLAGAKPQQSWQASSSLPLAVPDEVVILRLAAPAVTGAPPAAPIQLAASTTARSATLHWRSEGAMPAAFVVSRLGRYLATVVPAADGSASFTDKELMAGLDFPYAIRAVSPSGLLSPPAELMARTPNQLPDLIVESLAWDPPNPKPGDEVHFTFTIANIGTGPTPRVTHGVAILVDDKTTCWSDSSHEPLAPGTRRTLTTNNGPGGKATWTCRAGASHIKATVDDADRIDESNKQNNSLVKTLTTGLGEDSNESVIRP
jgi:hypothetical protein